MEFHSRDQVLAGPDLMEVVSISPDEDAMMLGFQLQDPEVNDIIRAAKVLEACQILPDTNLTAEENVELLLRTVRFLQLGLEVQLGDNDNIVRENNSLRDELKALEDFSRGLEDEVAELRELQDRAGETADARALEREIRELRQLYEDERKASDHLIEQADKDKQAMDDLLSRLTRAEEDLQRKQDDYQDLRDQLERLRDDYDELRQQHTALQAQGNTREQQREMGDTIRQQDWKIERLTKDNRALEAANVDLRSRLDSIKEENLQVSEKILAIDEECRQLRLHDAELVAKMEALTRERSTLMEVTEDLRSEIADKMALLDEFEDRFKRQYRSWEEEKASLVAQVEALKKEARLYVAKVHGPDSDDGESGADEDNLENKLLELKRQLDGSREKEVLLLEAYEQLEQDVGKEVDRALAKQAEELSRLSRRVTFLEGHLEKERAHVKVVEDRGASLEAQLEDALARNTQYESGVYGLPQAALEIKQLKQTVASNETRVKALIQQVNRVGAALEDLNDENTLLRRKAGIPAGTQLDISGLKMQKEITIAQLRSVNALLERQVSDLEEERRKLRLEVKFRVKYHGKAALEMGLTPEQLLLLEEFVEGLKGARNPEERLVAQLQQRIEFLEVRLAEVMAYADIPINMRPALIELDAQQLLPAAGSRLMVGAVPAAPVQQPEAGGLVGPGPVAVAAPPPAVSAATAAGLAGVKVTQLELVRSALANCLKMLRQMSDALGEHRQVSDADYRKFTESVINKMIDAEKVCSLILKDLSCSNLVPGAVGAAAAKDRAVAAAGWDLDLQAAPLPQAQGETQQEQQQPALRQQLQQRPATAESNFMADAAAEELRNRLIQLSRQLVDLQVLVAQKDAQLAHLSQHKATLEARLASSGVSGVAAAGGRRGVDYVPREQHEQLADEAAGLKEQLVECLEELDARERELAETQSACARYQGKMQELNDQVKMLYREYANNAANWRAERSTTEKQLKKAQHEAMQASAANVELEAALRNLEAGDGNLLKQQYVDSVRRLAIAQLKHAKIARKLEASVFGEKALQERVEELQEELQDVSSTCRTRMRWLESAAAEASRRTEQLFRCLHASAPLDVYQALVEKHKSVCVEYRKLLEERGDAVASAADELLEARQQMADLAVKYDAAQDTVAELREKLRQMELTSKLTGEAGHRDVTSLITQQLNQDLVAAQVSVEGLHRRIEMGVRERERIQQTLHEAQARVAELESRLAQTSAELASAQAVEVRLQQRLAGSKTAAEVEELYTRLDAAEAAAAKLDGATAALSAKAEEAEKKLLDLGHQKQRHLADITNLRCAMREMTGQSDATATIGKLQLELDHARGKEGMARGALNRSELERLELERNGRGLRQQLSRLTGQVAIHQDHAKWAETELQQAHAQLELGLASRTPTWKASLWARKLEQLKGRNDALADGLNSALRRLAKQEDKLEEAQLKVEMIQDIEALMSRGVSDIVREAATLKGAMATLKLEAGRLGRQKLLMRQKVSFLERVNAELSELLDKYDLESLSAHEALEADKKQLAGHSRTLQEEVARLQERSMALLVELEELKATRAAAGGLAGLGSRGPAASAAAAMQAAGVGAAERDMMLKQIESLKEARQEAEHLRQECRRLENELLTARHQQEDLQQQYDDVLDRFKQQSAAMVNAFDNGAAAAGSAYGLPADEGALAQLRAVAEASIKDLQSKVKDRESQVAALETRLQEHQAAYLAQHAADRAEIERLNSKLLETGAASIAGLKATLQRAATALAAAGDGREEVPYEQLRALLEERTGELEVVRNKLEQREASLELLRRNFDEQAQRYDADVQQLAAKLAAAPKEETPNRLSLQKLHSELKLKDERLRQLRAAIKALEGKLASLLKEKADQVMQASSWKEQELLDDRVAELESSNQGLATELAAARAEVATAQHSLAGQEAALRTLQEQLAEEKTALAAAREQLQKEQAKVRSLRAKANSKVAETAETGTPQDVTQLHQHVTALENENKQLSEANRQHVYAAAAGQHHHGVAGLQLGMKPIKTQRPARTSSSGSKLDGAHGDLSQPETPSASNVEAPPVWPRHRSSAGGGVSRMHSGMQMEVIAEEASRSSRGLTTGSGGGAGEAGEGMGGGRASEAGTASAVLQWEENKKLQGRIEALKRKLTLKSEEYEALKKESDKKAALAAALGQEKQQLAMALKAAKDRLQSCRQSQSGAAITQMLQVDASKLKDYVERVLELENQCEQLEQQLRLTKPQQQEADPHIPGMNSSRSQDQQQLFELQLQARTAEAKACRLEAHIFQLFGPEAAAVAAGGEPPGSGPGDFMDPSGSGSAQGGGADTGFITGTGRASGGGVDVKRRGTSSSGGDLKQQRKLNGREVELLSTITNLKAALERAMASSTPNTKYMQEVHRRKEAQKEAHALKEQLQRVQQQMASADSSMVKLQQENAELRVALQQAQQQAEAAAATYSIPAQQQQQLQALLGQREAQVQALRAQVQQLEQRLEAVCAAGGAGEAVMQLQVLKGRVAALEKDNQDLRAELSTFDPAFFDEIEDLKHDHFQLSQQCTAQQQTIERLRHQLQIAGVTAQA